MNRGLDSLLVVLFSEVVSTSPESSSITSSGVQNSSSQLRVIRN